MTNLFHALIVSFTGGLFIAQISMPSTAAAQANNATRITLDPAHIKMHPGNMLRQELKFYCTQPSRNIQLNIPNVYRLVSSAVPNFIQQAQLCQAPPIILKLTFDSNLLSANQNTIRAVELKRQIVTKSGVFSTPKNQVLQSSVVTVDMKNDHSNWTLSEVSPGEIIDFSLQPTPSRMIVGQAHTFRMTYIVAGLDAQNIIEPQFIDHGNIDVAKAVPNITVSTDEYNFPTVTFVQDWTLAPKASGHFHLSFVSAAMIADGEIKHQQIAFDVRVSPSNKFLPPVVNPSNDPLIQPHLEPNQPDNNKWASDLRLLIVSVIINLGFMIYLFKQPIMKILPTLFVQRKNLNLAFCIRACKEKKPLMARHYLHRWLTDTEQFQTLVTTEIIIQQTSNHCNPSAILALDRACFTAVSNWDANTLIQWTNDYKLALRPNK